MQLFIERTGFLIGSINTDGLFQNYVWLLVYFYYVDISNYEPWMRRQLVDYRLLVGFG